MSGNLSKGSQNPGAGVERRGEGTSPARVPRRPRAGPALLVCVSFQVKRTVRRAAGRPRRGRRPRTRLRGIQQPCSPAAVSGGDAAFGGLGLGECPEEPRACHRVRPGSHHMGERAASLAVAQPGLSGLADVELWCPTGPRVSRAKGSSTGMPRKTRSRVGHRGLPAPPRPLLLRTVSSPAKGRYRTHRPQFPAGPCGPVWSDRDRVFEDNLGNGCLSVLRLSSHILWKALEASCAVTRLGAAKPGFLPAFPPTGDWRPAVPLPLTGQRAGLPPIPRPLLAPPQAPQGAGCLQWAPPSSRDGILEGCCA